MATMTRFIDAKLLTIHDISIFAGITLMNLKHSIHHYIEIIYKDDKFSIHTDNAALMILLPKWTVTNPISVRFR